MIYANINIQSSLICFKLSKVMLFIQLTCSTESENAAVPYTTMLHSEQNCAHYLEGIL